MLISIVNTSQLLNMDRNSEGTSVTIGRTLPSHTKQPDTSSCWEWKANAHSRFVELADYCKAPI